MRLGPSLLVYLPLAASALIYTSLLATFLFVAWRRRRSPAVADRPLISILKPLAGRDDELSKNLETFAKLDYPHVELLLGVASATDPAHPIARAFVAAHPELSVRIVITDPHAALNPKVAQLIGLERAASGELLLISDANVRVRPDDLQSLVAELFRPGVGLVSSVVVGTGERTLGAALENLQLGAQVAPGVLASTILGERPLTIGKSMILRRADLARIGGFSAVGNVLAEDHMMARLMRAIGLQVGLSLRPIENRNVACSVGRTIERHCRWAKMRRAILPGTFFTIEPLLSPLVIATLTVAIAPNRTTLIFVALAALLQSVAAWTALRVLRGSPLRALYFPLEIVRAYLLFFCWLVAAFSRRVDWRGHAFVLGPDSVLVPAGETWWRRVRRTLAT